MAIREGRWDCTSCGSTGIYGRHVDCPGCGRPRPGNVRFYLTDDAPVITDPERLTEARAGADWACAHCGATSRATAQACGGCGAPRGSLPGRATVDYAAKDVPRAGDVSTGAGASASADAVSGDAAPRAGAGPPEPEPVSAGTIPPPDAEPEPLAVASTSTAAASSQAPETAPEPVSPAPATLAATSGPEVMTNGELLRRLFKRLAYIVGVPAALAVVVFAWGVLTEPEPWERRTPVTVLEKEWTREIIRGRNMIVEESGWDAPPPEATLVRTEQRVHHHQRVLVGYDTTWREETDVVEVPDGYEWDEETVTEQVAEGTYTYSCGQRDLGNGYFEDRTCTGTRYGTRTTTRPVQRTRYRTDTVTRHVNTRTPVYRQDPVRRPWYVYRVMRFVATDTFVARSSERIPDWPVAPPDTAAREMSRRSWGTVEAHAEGGYGGRRYGVNVDSLTWPRVTPGMRGALDPSGYRLLPVDSLPDCIRWRRDGKRRPPASLGCTPPPAERAP